MELNDDNGVDDKNSRKRKIEKDEYGDHDAISNPLEGVFKSDIKSSLSEDEADTCEKSDYGLNPQYLKSLRITPPLDRWVFVNNIRCDKSELRDILELAGQVVICAWIANHTKCAKVMYSHPLEAVQAVSMFNGQKLYGKKLRVRMMKWPPDTVVLPKGLTDVGPGLGTKGKPLREIVKHYNKFLKHKESDINVSLFDKSDGSQFINEDNRKEESSVKDDSSDDDVSSQGSMNTNVSINKEFKVTSVEDLDEISSENSNKKAKLYSITSSITNISSSNSVSEKDKVSPSEKALKLIKDKFKFNQKDSHFSHNIRKAGYNENQVVLYRPNSASKCVQSSASRPYQSPGHQPLGPPRLPASGPHVNIGPSVPRPMSSSFASISMTTVSNINMGPPAPAPFGSRMGPQSGLQIGPQMGQQVVPQMGSPIVQQMGPPMGHQVGQQIGPPMGQQMGQQMGPPMGQQMGPPMGQQTGQQMGPPMGLQTGPQMGQQMGPQMGLQTGPQMGPQTGPQTGPQMGPQIGPQTGPQTRPPMMSNPNLGPIRGPMVLPVPRPPMGTPELFTLLFCNLPPSTTFPLLCEKVSQCGQIMSLQLTTPGCAVAQFVQKAHAERCFQLFNGKCIDGHVIEVRIG